MRWKDTFREYLAEWSVATKIVWNNTVRVLHGGDSIVHCVT